MDHICDRVSFASKFQFAGYEIYLNNFSMDIFQIIFVGIKKRLVPKTSLKKLSKI